jgi:hypothetical protein
VRFPHPGKKRGNGRAAAKAEPRVTLDHAQSTTVREKLLGEIEGLTSADNAADWARDALPAKNTLAEFDATRVEEAFEQKVSALIAAESVGGAPAQAKIGDEVAPAVVPPVPDPSGETTLAISKPRRYRNKDHLRYVARQACLICGRQPSDPHHLRYAQPRALGRKASDEFTVPRCRVHHREVHRIGNEPAWWQAAGIDPLSVAQKLWNTTRMNEGRIKEDEAHRRPSGTGADPTEKTSKEKRKVPAKRSGHGQRTAPT